MTGPLSQKLETTPRKRKEQKGKHEEEEPKRRAKKAQREKQRGHRRERRGQGGRGGRLAAGGATRGVARGQAGQGAPARREPGRGGRGLPPPKSWSFFVPQKVRTEVQHVPATQNVQFWKNLGDE